MGIGNNSGGLNRCRSLGLDNFGRDGLTKPLGKRLFGTSQCDLNAAGRTRCVCVIGAASNSSVSLAAWAEDLHRIILCGDWSGTDALHHNCGTGTIVLS